MKLFLEQKETKGAKKDETRSFTRKIFSLRFMEKARLSSFPSVNFISVSES